MLRFNSTPECEIAHKNATFETAIDYEIINSDEIYGPIYESEPGHSEKMGVNLEGSGCNVAIWAGTADIVDVCIFDDNNHNKTLERWRLKRELGSENGIFCGHIPGLQAGDLYGLRVNGEWDPNKQKTYDYSKLLIDPYAKAITDSFDITAKGQFDLNNNLFAKKGIDSALFVPRCVVVNESYDWEDDKLPKIPKGETIIYEGHVKGMTYLNNNIPEHERGKYAGVASEPFINHLKELGITTLELLPVQHFVTEPFLQSKGKSNYFGYNTLGFFAPHAEYSSKGQRGEQVTECKDMIKKLHKADIEVILDVEYNHTPEGSEDGPTLSFKGLGGREFYLYGDDGKHCNYSGCGNTINASSDSGLNFIISSLSYWAKEMHVDGFRFDLATILARESPSRAINLKGRFFEAVENDPILSKLKLIVEPWDCDKDSYRLGQFSDIWQEWNGKFRDNIRDFWRGKGSLAHLALCMAGSPLPNEKRINFATCHDGKTIYDLVSYEEKHNYDNGEDNKDGTNDDRSSNFGHEGPTDDKNINNLRERVMRSMITSTILAAGTPMISHGDEIHRTQGGNNNGYCLDNEAAQMRWDWSEEERKFFKFVSGIIHFRKKYPVFTKTSPFAGTQILGPNTEKDIAWFTSEGHEFEYNDMAWKDKKMVLGMFLSDIALNECLIYYANGTDCEQTARLPIDSVYYGEYEKIIDTVSGEICNEGEGLTINTASFVLGAFSSVVLRRKQKNVYH